tara:strand:- start:386 stop:520 length:135 start_codon:yes stop_codon:yes gene_type:complete
VASVAISILYKELGRLDIQIQVLKSAKLLRLSHIKIIFVVLRTI